MLLQSQKTALRPVTTAHLAQTMSLLELNNEDLYQKIEIELASNPALETTRESKCAICHRPLVNAGRCPVCSIPEGIKCEEPIVFISPRTDFTPSKTYSSEDDYQSNDWVAEVDDLPTFVLRQIAPELTPDEQPLAAHILTSLDEDGLLSIQLFEIARFHHVPITRVENVLGKIQRADPVGVGSPTPQAALLVQLEVLAENQKVPNGTREAIENGMDLLSRRAYNELGRLLNISTEDASHIASFVAENLNPFPARAHWGNQRSIPPPVHTYRNPDVIVSSLSDSTDSPLIIEIVAPYAGALQVNPLFRQAIADAPPEKASEWQDDLESANLLIKCLQQRNHTLVRLMQRLATLQRQYFLEGDAHLIPVTRAQVATDLEVHESTISRAVADKAVQLPSKRIVPMAKLFDRSLHIRTAIVEIIAQEKNPLSDSQIASMLDKIGYQVARRTVAKYRGMEGILPARLRKPTPTFHE